MEITDDFIFFKGSQRQAQDMDAVYQKSKGMYRIPNTLGALRELHLLGFDVKEYGVQKALERQRSMLYKDVPYPKADERLRPYQQQDINFLIQQPHLANFSQMRTGKTPVMCQVLQVRKVQSLIVVPTSLTLNWVNEVHKWTSLKAETVGNLAPAKRKGMYQRFRNKEFDVLVISRSLVKNDIEYLLHLGIELMMIDEAHFLRNYRSLQSQAMYKLGQTMSHRYVITGTPASNNNDDVFGLLKFLYPKKYPSYWQFVERYFKVEEGFFGKKVGGFKSDQRKKEFWETVAEISVQHKLKDVLKWLPSTQYQTVQLEMGKKQRKMYEDMLNLFAVQDTDLSAPSVLAQLTRLRQLTVAPEMLELDSPSVKEEFLMEWLSDNPNESVLVFSSFSSYLKRLNGRIKGSKLITGESSQKDRQTIVQDFQTGKSRVILANIVAAGEGLTLDQASTVIFLDRAYNPNANEQAEARIIATTETSEVQKALVIDLVCKDSIDEKILKMVKQKQNITKIVNDYKSMEVFLNERV